MKKSFVKLLSSIVFLLLFAWIWLMASIYYYSRIEDIQVADGIVVLGASQWDGLPSPVFMSRLDAAYSLYDKKYASKIILTGGVGKGERDSEANAGRNYLINRGVAKENFFKEEKGRTTKESLDGVKDILIKQNIKSVIFVSDGFHMLRLRSMVKDLDIKSFFYPVQDGPIVNNKLVKFRYCVRESFVYLIYLIFNI